ncbi:MAG: hypothetical protein FWB76_01845 [Oscillospiraceae bacterium]|nr:hypothetical protein [Oscillospiraceae bacterium]
MSMPAFPENNGNFTLEGSISQILSSIALEELGLSHIINAEGEKIQYVLGTLPEMPAPNPPTIDDLLKINRSVQDMLNTVSMNQMFLLGKMSTAINMYLRSGDTDNSNDTQNATAS